MQPTKVNEVKKEKIILGIDPGYDRVGWAIGKKINNKFQSIALGCIQTQKEDDIFIRYNKIQSDLKEIIEYFKPSELAIETLFFSKSKKTALRVSEARGVIIATCLDYNLKVFEYSPNAIKIAITGDGSANKQAIEKMVKLQIDGEVNQKIDDALDALAIALTHSVSVFL